MTLKVLYFALCLLFACSVTITEKGDHIEGENGNSDTKFNQDCPLYTYEINK